MRPVDAPSFCYRGGKGRLRRWIVRWTPESGSVYCEPFAGRANVFFLMALVSKFKSWWLNDLRTDKFLRAILDYKGQELPFVKESDVSGMDEYLKLLLEPVIFWAGGVKDVSCATGVRVDLEWYRKNILKAQNILCGAQITNRDALEVLGSSVLDGDSFLYIDPPYLSGNVTLYSSKDIDREAMISCLKKASYRWLLSEYYCEDIVRVFGEPLAIRVFRVHSNPRTPAKIVRECLWANYSAEIRRIDFEDSEKPLEISQNILRLNGSLSFNSFVARCPERWTAATRKAQFDRLCAYADNYWDGNIVSYVHKRESSFLGGLN